MCKQVSTESHEIENVISSDFLCKSRGFLTSSFIRPPVNILVQFPCPVQLCCILINGKLGNQQSVGCEIFVQSQAPGGSDPFNHGIFRTLGKYYWDCDKKGVHLIGDQHSVCKLAENEDYVSQRLNKERSQTLNLVHSLRLSILKTHLSSIPALAGLEAWGYVSHTSDPETARRVLYKWHRLKNPQWITDNIREKVVEIINSEEPDRKHKDSPNIPEEFLDNITYEIMAMPVRLPSGNVVDESTLKRFNDQQASWGRSPSDPFTGKLFNADHKPLFDTSLKARIDSYLLRESHREDLWNIPRTTGPIMRHSDTILSNQPIYVCSRKPPAAVPFKSDDSSRRWLSNLAGNLRGLSRPKVTAVKVATAKAPAVKKTVVVCSCDGDGAMIYSLPCQHSICRTCLLDSKSKNSLLCPTCRSPFAVHQPIRLHTQPNVNSVIVIDD